MQWPKNDGNKLDDDPTMTKFMVGVLVRFKLSGSIRFQVVNKGPRVKIGTSALPRYAEIIEPSKSVLYIAINCRWEEAQPILAHDDLQFACWKMMDYKMDCRKGI